MGIRFSIRRPLSNAVRQAMRRIAINNIAPTADNVSFTGTLSIGSTLTATYDYADVNGDPESGSAYQWYRADDAAGTGAAAIAGETDLTYVVQSADMDKYIRFGVTPSDGALTGTEVFSAWQQAWTTNPLWANTVLLAHLDGSNGATGPYTDSAPNAHTVSRISTGVLSTSQKKFGSASFAGAASDGLTITGTLTDFNFGTTSNDWTVAAWFYFSDVASQQTLFDWRGTNGPTCYISGANIIYSSTANNEILAPIAHGMSVDTWNLVEISRVGGVVRLFINGALIRSAADTTTYGTPSVGMKIGSSGAGNLVTAHVDECLVLKGLGWHSAAYVVPTIPFPGQYMEPHAPTVSNVAVSAALLLGSYTFSDALALSESGTTYQWYIADDAIGTNAAPVVGQTSISYTSDQPADIGKYVRLGVTPNNGVKAGTETFSSWVIVGTLNSLWANTVLYTALDGSNGSTSFSDLAPSNHTIARANSAAALSTSIKKFGTAAVFNSGGVDGLNITGTLTDFTFGTGDWTVAGWFYFADVASLQTVFDWRGSGGPTLYLAGTDIVFDTQGGATAITGAHGMSVNTWYFIELTKVSGTTRLFVGGTQKGSSYSDSVNYGIGSTMRIGTGPAGTLAASSGIDDVFVLKGAGWHTANYTPPAVPWGKYQ